MRWRTLLASMVAVGSLCVGEKTAQAQGGADRAFNVFLDCSGFYCDNEFFRTEIVSVNWVRFRNEADIHILATTQPTGGGGTYYTFAFLGQRNFAGLADTLTWIAPQASTSDETRRGIARTLQLGLVRYLVRSGASDRLTVTFAPATSANTPAAATRDPWHAWVYSLGGHGNLFREESYKRIYLNGRVSAKRVTNSWKTVLSANENISRTSYEFNGQTSKFVQRAYEADVLQVKSLGDHWAAGARGEFSSSTFLNERVAARLTPAVEYDVFPYAESTRRQLRLQYGVGLSTFSYYDTTRFDKLHETLPVQTFTTVFGQRQTWGSMNAGVEAVSYLSDLSRRRISYSLGADVRIVKGLSVNFSGGYESIHDQFFIPKETISRDRALLRQTQQTTRFSQFLFVGLNYSFGSVFNNVVNPRFSDSGNGFFFMN